MNTNEDFLKEIENLDNIERTEQFPVWQKIVSYIMKADEETSKVIKISLAAKLNDGNEVKEKIEKGEISDILLESTLRAQLGENKTSSYYTMTFGKKNDNVDDFSSLVKYIAPAILRNSSYTLRLRILAFSVIFRPKKYARFEGDEEVHNIIFDLINEQVQEEKNLIAKGKDIITDEMIEEVAYTTRDYFAAFLIYAGKTLLFSSLNSEKVFFDKFLKVIDGFFDNNIENNEEEGEGVIKKMEKGEFISFSKATAAFVRSYLRNENEVSKETAQLLFQFATLEKDELFVACFHMAAALFNGIYECRINSPLNFEVSYLGYIWGGGNTINNYSLTLIELLAERGRNMKLFVRYLINTLCQSNIEELGKAFVDRIISILFNIQFTADFSMIFPQYANIAEKKVIAEIDIFTRKQQELLRLFEKDVFWDENVCDLKKILNDYQFPSTQADFVQFIGTEVHPDKVFPDIFGLSDEYNWSELGHAYGPAVGTPRDLLCLYSTDGNVRDEGLSQLSMSIVHQGSRYTATAPAISVIARTLNYRSIPYKRILYEFIRFAAYPWKHYGQGNRSIDTEPEDPKDEAHLATVAAFSAVPLYLSKFLEYCYVEDAGLKISESRDWLVESVGLLVGCFPNFSFLSFPPVAATLAHTLKARCNIEVTPLPTTAQSTKHRPQDHNQDLYNPNRIQIGLRSIAGLMLTLTHLAPWICSTRILINFPIFHDHLKAFDPTFSYNEEFEKIEIEGEAKNNNFDQKWFIPDNFNQISLFFISILNQAKEKEEAIFTVSENEISTPPSKRGRFNNESEEEEGGDLVNIEDEGDAELDLDDLDEEGEEELDPEEFDEEGSDEEVANTIDLSQNRDFYTILRLMASVGLARLYGAWKKEAECPLEAQHSILSFVLLPQEEVKRLQDIYSTFNLGNTDERHTLPTYLQTGSVFLHPQTAQSFYRKTIEDFSVKKTKGLFEAYIRSYFPKFRNVTSWGGWWDKTAKADQQLAQRLSSFSNEQQEALRVMMECFPAFMEVHLNKEKKNACHIFQERGWGVVHDTLRGALNYSDNFSPDQLSNALKICTQPIIKAKGVLNELIQSNYDNLLEQFPKGKHVYTFADKPLIEIWNLMAVEGMSTGMYLQGGKCISGRIDIISFIQIVIKNLDLSNPSTSSLLLERNAEKIKEILQLPIKTAIKVLFNQQKKKNRADEKKFELEKRDLRYRSGLLNTSWNNKLWNVIRDYEQYHILYACSTYFNRSHGKEELEEGEMPPSFKGYLRSYNIAKWLFSKVQTIPELSTLLSINILLKGSIINQLVDKSSQEYDKHSEIDLAVVREDISVIEFFDLLRQPSNILPLIGVVNKQGALVAEISLGSLSSLLPTLFFDFIGRLRGSLIKFLSEYLPSALHVQTVEINYFERDQFSLERVGKLLKLGGDEEDRKESFTSVWVVSNRAPLAAFTSTKFLGILESLINDA